MARKPVDITDFIKADPAPEPPPKRRKPRDTFARKTTPSPFPDATPEEKKKRAKPAKRSHILWWIFFILVICVIFGD